MAALAALFVLLKKAIVLEFQIFPYKTFFLNKVKQIYKTFCKDICIFRNDNTVYAIVKN